MSDDEKLEPANMCREDLAHGTPQNVERKWFLPALSWNNNSDLSDRSFVILRANGTGHISAQIDNNYTWGFAFDAWLPNGAPLFSVPAASEPNTYVRVDIHSREKDVVYAYGGILAQIGILTVRTYHPWARK
jgi:hypothetical protein